MTENRESTCAKCGRKITAADINCPLCGALTAPGRLEPKSRVAYVLLAFFFGWAGIHNFYAKRTGEGLVQLGVTLLSCGLMLWAVELWVLIEMFTVSRDGRNVPMRGRGILTAAILLAAGALLFFGAVGYPFYLRCRQEAALTGCREHLSRIGAALLLYADENGGAFPAADGIPGFEALPLAERFYRLGFRLEATAGTAAFLHAHGIPAVLRGKLSEGSEEILDSIRFGRVSYIINTRAILSGVHYEDGVAIRRCAIQNGVTIFTSLDTARIVLDVLEESIPEVSSIGG